MSTIAVDYETRDGEKKKELIEIGPLMGVHLTDREIVNIDLGSLKNCEAPMFSVWLDNNNLEQLNLEPLAGCTGLDTLSLSNNKLRHLDLRFLSNCRKLRGLYLKGNSLETVQLAQWNDLRYLSLEQNNLSELDLSPLANSTKLREIRLSQNSLETVDITYLNHCTDLEVLSLADNQLQHTSIPRKCPNLKWVFLENNGFQSIDLSSLQGCISLEYLQLNGNRLRQIDLGPLAGCTGLKRLWLHKNHLQTIDLEPLASCSNLRDLNIGANKLEKIDLSPLIDCSSLQRLDLSSTECETLDLTPLANCRNLYRIGLWGFNEDAALSLLSKATMKRQLSMRGTLYMRNYDAPVPLRNPKVLRKLAPIINQHEPNSWKHIHLTRCLAETVGIGGLGFLDITSRDLVSILDESTASNIQDRLIELYHTQLDTEGTTIGFDTDLEHLDHPELREMVTKVVKLRDREIQVVSLHIDYTKDIVDLRPLWLTGHGYETLLEMGLGTHCSRGKISEIDDALQHTGYSVNIVEEDKTTHTQTRMSKNMEDYISALVTPLKVSFEELHGVGPKTPKLLKKAGYTSVWMIAEGNSEALGQSVSGISGSGARKVVSSAQDITRRLRSFRSGM